MVLAERLAQSALEPVEGAQSLVSMAEIELSFRDRRSNLEHPDVPLTERFSHARERGLQSCERLLVASHPGHECRDVRFGYRNERVVFTEQLAAQRQRLLEVAQRRVGFAQLREIDRHVGEAVRNDRILVAVCGPPGVERTLKVRGCLLTSRRRLPAYEMPAIPPAHGTSARGVAERAAPRLSRPPFGQERAHQGPSPPGDGRGTSCWYDCGAMRNQRVQAILGGLLLATACNVADAQPASDHGVVEPAGAALAGSEVDRFVGKYRFAGGQAQRNALREAIEELVQAINVLVRGKARTKLEETNPVFDSVVIERGAGTLVLTFGTLKNACKLDGSATQVDGIDGSKLTCRLSMENGALVQRLSGSRGGRDNTITVDEHGKLRVKTRIHSRLMPKDLRYKLTYARR
jgi:hypothetical protein